MVVMLRVVTVPSAEVYLRKDTRASVISVRLTPFLFGVKTLVLSASRYLCDLV